MPLHKAIPEVVRPNERNTVDDRARRRRIVLTTKRFSDAIDVTRADETDKDLLPLGCDLDHFQTAVQQYEEGRGRLPLPEDLDSLRDALRFGVSLSLIHISEPTRPY